MNLYRKKFGFRIFIALTCFIFLISSAFTLHHVVHQHRAMNENLIQKGLLLTDILAMTTRIGAAEEKPDRLKETMQSIFQHPDVLAVFVYDAAGRVLWSEDRGSENDGTPAYEGISIDRFQKRFITGGAFFQFRLFDKCADFCASVRTGDAYGVWSSIGFQDAAPAATGELIGAVRIRLDRTQMNRRYRDVLCKSIFIGLFFWGLGSVGAVLIFRSVTRPLARLTPAAIDLTEGRSVHAIAACGGEEIANRACAFNRMASFLPARENALRESEKRLRFLSSRLIAAQEQERWRISKELHDEMGHSLAVLKHRVRAVLHRLPRSLPELRAECSETVKHIDMMIENMRRLLQDLRPSVLDDLGLSAALAWMVEKFEKQYRVDVFVKMTDIDRCLRPESQINLYRIFQEGLTNIGKHAHASRVSLTIRQNAATICFELADNGVGFDLAEIKQRNPMDKGMGLETIQERAFMIGAELDITSKIGQGSRLMLKMPVEQ